MTSIDLLCEVDYLTSVSETTSQVIGEMERLQCESWAVAHSDRREDAAASSILGTKATDGTSYHIMFYHGISWATSTRCPLG